MLSIWCFNNIYQKACQEFGEFNITMRYNYSFGVLTGVSEWTQDWVNKINVNSYKIYSDIKSLILNPVSRECNQC